MRSRAPTSAAAVVDRLFGLYAARGDTRYDEAVTQTEHALQTATLAAAHAPPALVAAALLHDIGHLIADEHADRDGFLTVDERHEELGAAELARWFPAEVTGPVALHVPAKRYLVATDPAYHAALSEASVRSLAVQGGPMSAAQCRRFARARHAEAACRLRRWDDRAKVDGRAIPGLEHYRPVLERLVARTGGSW